ncbi:hypothetical protein WK56_24215 [Burkholderia ubonensis]|nr:hypothetical protein WK56_24215 [Burkholderia ubonensis]
MIVRRYLHAKSDRPQLPVLAAGLQPQLAFVPGVEIRGRWRQALSRAVATPATLNVDARELG